MGRLRESDEHQTIGKLNMLADRMMLNAGFIDNPGLAKGKMGIAVFMYHYARFSGNKAYEKFAGNLIDQIYDDINSSTPIDFENGLTGIGWGIIYLIKNGFIKGDLNDVLEEIDNAIGRDDHAGKESDSGVAKYLLARRSDSVTDIIELLSFIRPDYNAVDIAFLINPDNYGLFNGLAGNGLKAIYCLESLAA